MLVLDQRLEPGATITITNDGCKPGAPGTAGRPGSPGAGPTNQGFGAPGAAGRPGAAGASSSASAHPIDSMPVTTHVPSPTQEP